MDGLRNRLVRHEVMENLVVNYFQALLSEPSLDRSKSILRITRHIPRLISHDQNKTLMQILTLEEIEDVFKGVEKNIAPGLDRFMIFFYQATWRFIGRDILEVVDESRHN